MCVRMYVGTYKTIIRWELISLPQSLDLALALAGARSGWQMAKTGCDQLLCEQDTNTRTHTDTNTHPHTQNKGKYSFRICELLDLHCIPNVFHNSFRGAAPQQQISKQTKPNKIKQNSKKCFKIHRQWGRVEGEVTAKKKDNNNNNNLIVIDGRNKR